MPQYQKLRADIEQLGYQWTERNDIICSSHGDHTSRTRYFAVATRDDLPPFVFPEPTSSYKGMWHLLEPESKVRRLVRCSAHSHGFLRERWRKRSVNQFHSNQIGTVREESEGEIKFLEARKARFPHLRNHKGYRVYLPGAPAPTIMAHGREQTCGPGRHTQLILDAQNNIRLISVREAAGAHSFLARVIESLVLLCIREATAYRLIGGNSQPDSE
jgi:site-specific DNA-cytosine methylase